MSEWVTAAFTARQNEYHQYRQGMLDEEVWEAIENIIKLLMGIPWIQDWWAQSFVHKVESLGEAWDRDVARELSSVFLRPGN